jgi:hypothetical protein
MDDPIFRAYMKRVPPMAHALSHGEPWQLWIRRENGQWQTKRYATYREVWPVFIKLFRNSPEDDPTITSRRVFYAPPGEFYKVKVRRTKPTPSGETHRIEERWRQTFFWEGTDVHWCGRCRRPVFWQALWPGHHAMKRQPTMATEDNMRCVICGIRWIGQPSIEGMVKL